MADAFVSNITTVYTHKLHLFSYHKTKHSLRITDVWNDLQKYIQRKTKLKASNKDAKQHPLHYKDNQEKYKKDSA